MIAAGTRLGPYEVLAALGAGGMGEVYKGRDTRLDRSVAIKVLPPHLSSDPDFKLRFDREARVISGFTHPHICALHDVGEEAGLAYLVMEYCDGETLADRLEKGPLPVEQVLKYGIQIADALDRAHRSGIVHRDLKPGNVMLTKSGAKLLDFGLAKPTMALATLDGATEQKPLTAEGAIIGTFQYMAPEQLEGREADARTDIFAFGAILYEMATGRRAFEGKSKASLIAAILERQPQRILELQPLTPPALDRLIRTALEKDPDDRWQNAHDMLLELRWLAEGGSQAGVPALVMARRKSRERLGWIVAAIAVVVAIAAGTLAGRVPAKRPVSTRTQILPPPLTAFDFAADSAGSLTISPDGTRITFAARAQDGIRRLWVRPLDSLEASELAGTDGAIYPFWSPDNRFIAFFAGGKLKRIPADGGPAMSVCDVDLNPRSGSWSKDDVMIFAPSSVAGIHSVRASGGRPQPVTRLDRAAGDTTHRWVTFLPDQKHFLYLAGSHYSGTESEKHAIYAGSLDGKTRKLVLHARSNPLYASGHLLFIRDGVLLAHRFDPDKLAVESDPMVVAAGVAYSASFFHGPFSASSNGTIVYAPGASDPNARLSWFSPDGRFTPTAAEPARFQDVSTSPDGARAAVMVEDPATGSSDIWIYDLVQGGRTRFTFGAAREVAPLWSPDGRNIVYAGEGVSNNWSDLYIKPVSGGGGEEVLLKSSAAKIPSSISADGRFVAFDKLVEWRGGLSSDVWIVSLAGERKATPFLATEFTERAAQFSPDGQWISYVSDEAGRPEIYVTSFPVPGPKWQISSGGAQWGAWSRDGKAFHYVRGNSLHAVDITETGDGLVIGRPRLLFADSSILGGDPRSDGERFLMIHHPPEAQDARITVITNWTVP